jgi:hypothetical protein
MPFHSPLLMEPCKQPGSKSFKWRPRFQSRASTATLQALSLFDRQSATSTATSAIGRGYARVASNLSLQGADKPVLLSTVIAPEASHNSWKLKIPVQRIALPAVSWHGGTSAPPLAAVLKAAGWQAGCCCPRFHQQLHPGHLSRVCCLQL